ncbi:hypothetical protein BCEN4_250017 [Burkholderia cenocepacia]|nr:hypothetical protein BCEN4_250017 [Burkholderia cenocepacia]
MEVLMAAATPTGALVALHHVSFRFDDGVTLFDSLDLSIDRTAHRHRRPQRRRQEPARATDRRLPHAERGDDRAACARRLRRTAA